jgi:hypothetical protein
LQGSHTLGCPLLQTDVWKSKNSCGINAISLDCRTQQRSDKNITEVILFHKNVPLRPVDIKDELFNIHQPLWIYDKNNVLARWKAEETTKPKSQIYREVAKIKINASYALFSTFRLQPHSKIAGLGSFNPFKMNLLSKQENLASDYLQ